MIEKIGGTENGYRLPNLERKVYLYLLDTDRIICNSKTAEAFSLGPEKIEIDDGMIDGCFYINEVS